jgi:hypothetical protein
MSVMLTLLPVACLAVVRIVVAALTVKQRVWDATLWYKWNGS